MTALENMQEQRKLSPTLAPTHAVTAKAGFKAWMNHYLSEAVTPAPSPGRLEKRLQTEAQALVAMQERIYHLEQLEEVKRDSRVPTSAPPTTQPTSLWHTHEHPECPATKSDISRCALERGCCAKGRCVVGNASACERQCSLSDVLTYCLSSKAVMQESSQLNSVDACRYWTRVFHSGH